MSTLNSTMLSAVDIIRSDDMRIVSAAGSPAIATRSLTTVPLRCVATASITPRSTVTSGNSTQKSFVMSGRFSPTLRPLT